MRRIIAAFDDSGISLEKIGRFLSAEPRRGEGRIRDQIAAEATNQLLDALGQPAQQSPADVKRLRERGAWRAFDRRPEQ